MVNLAAVHQITIYLPDSPILIAVLVVVTVLIVARSVGWIWQQFPFT